MAKTIIRHATASDFQVLLKIDAASFPEGMAYDSDELSYFMNRRGAETMVLEHNGSISGFFIVEVDPGSKVATLVTLDVLEDCRRLGFGSQLLRQSETVAVGRDAKLYRLQVDVTNAGAIAFYGRHGFRAARRLRHYYSDGHDAYLMTKTLRQSDGT